MSTIFDSKFAPARKLIDDRLRAVMAGRIKIGSGAGMDSAWDGGTILPPNKTICIMEATSYILGYTNPDDHPPCTSEVIRNFLIEVNDCEITMRKRAMLKALIPNIINTAPTRWKKGGIVPRLETFLSNPEYKKAEITRKGMLAEWKDANSSRDRHGYDNENWHERLENGKLPMRAVLDIARAMADVARFDGQNEITENGQGGEAK